MFDSKIILTIIIILLFYTLYYTFFNDYGIFLLIVLLLLTGIYFENIIDEKIFSVTNRIDTIKNNITSQLSEYI